MNKNHIRHIRTQKKKTYKTLFALYGSKNLKSKINIEISHCVRNDIGRQKRFFFEAETKVAECPDDNRDVPKRRYHKTK